MLERTLLRLNEERKTNYQRFSIFLFCIAAIDAFMAQEIVQQPTLSRNDSRTFQVKRAPDGRELCASDTPSAVYNTSQLDKPPFGPECVPGSVLCAWKCTTDESCISFNWKYDIDLCEVFYFVPVRCDFVAGCAFHEVGTPFSRHALISCDAVVFLIKHSEFRRFFYF